MSHRKWHGDATKQQMLRACDSRVAADILNIMAGAARKKAPPHIPMDAPERFYQVSMSHLASMIGCCRKTVNRAIRRLVERGFITIHYDHSLDRRNRYQVNLAQVENWLQRMPLFEATEENDNEPLGQNVPMERDKMSQCTVSECPNGEGQNVPMYSTSYSSSDTIIINSDAGALEERDEEKEMLIEECRSLEVSKEVAEHFLTIRDRKTLRNGILYVRKRCAREKVGNPGGLLNRFCQRPWEHGHERDKFGVWVPVAVMASQRQKVSTVSVDPPKDVCRKPFTRPAALLTS